MESRGGGCRGVLPTISSIHMQIIIFNQKLTLRLAVFFYFIFKSFKRNITMGVKQAKVFFFFFSVICLNNDKIKCKNMVGPK